LQQIHPANPLSINPASIPSEPVITSGESSRPIDASASTIAVNASVVAAVTNAAASTVAANLADKITKPITTAKITALQTQHGISNLLFYLKEDENSFSLSGSVRIAPSRQ
jgi:hypothetical protein